MPLTRSATKHYDRATNAHFQLDKPGGATGKSLIVLNPWLTLNQRVPGSSPGAPTRKPQQINAMLSRAADFCRCLIARVTTGVTDDKRFTRKLSRRLFVRCSLPATKGP